MFLHYSSKYRWTCTRFQASQINLIYLYLSILYAILKVWTSFKILIELCLLLKTLYQTKLFFHYLFFQLYNFSQNIINYFNSVYWNTLTKLTWKICNNSIKVGSKKLLSSFTFFLQYWFCLFPFDNYFRTRLPLINDSIKINGVNMRLIDVRHTLQNNMLN